MELDPLYVDTALRRFEKLTDADAIHAASGRTFSEVENELSGSGGAGSNDSQLVRQPVRTRRRIGAA